MKPAWRASSRGHEGEEVVDVAFGDALLDFGVEDAAGEFGGNGADEEIHEFGAQGGRAWRRSRDRRVRCGCEVGFVGMSRLSSAMRSSPFGADGGDVDALHGGEVGGVEARGRGTVSCWARRVALVHAGGAVEDRGVGGGGS